MNADHSSRAHKQIPYPIPSNLSVLIPRNASSLNTVSRTWSHPIVGHSPT
jgi:hypothetical protein